MSMVVNPTNQYRSSLGVATNQASMTPEQAVTNVHSWYTSSGRSEFVQAFEHETGLPLATSRRSDGALVEQGYPKNVNEYNNKAAWDQYYIANGLIALRELDKIFGAITPVPIGEAEIYYKNLLGLTRHLFFDTMILIDDWATFSQKVPGIYGVGKNQLEHAMAIFQSAKQVIYGNYSPFAFTDNHSDTSINQLRMAIEIRLRRGFGVVAKLDKSGAVVPLALSDVIEAIRPYKSSIKFSVPFEHVERLYGWANIYMHLGLKQYTWSPIYALDYLRSFLIGGKHSGGSSVHAGIIVKRGVVKQVQSAVESGIDKTRHTLEINEPEQCDLILEK